MIATSTQMGVSAAEATSKGDGRSSGAAHGRFFFWFFLFPALAYLAAFGLVRLPTYDRWTPSRWGPMLDFAFESGQQDADVLVFGDSSAFIGVDPRLVNGKLGKKTVVLPGTIGSLPITGDMALERYLARNAAPQLLVLYFSPWNLDYLRSENAHWFEGEEMLFRHGSGGEIGRFMLRHPVETLLFPLRLYSLFDPRLLRAALREPDRELATASALGHVDDTDPFPILPDTCRLPEKLLAGGSVASVQALAAKYRARMPVMVYLAPIPECGNAGAVLARSFAGLQAAAPEHLPANEFLFDPNYAHIRPKFVPSSTQLFAEALRERLAPESETRSAR